MDADTEQMKQGSYIVWERTPCAMAAWPGVCLQTESIGHGVPSHTAIGHGVASHTDAICVFRVIRGLILIRVIAYEPF
jgi:hypothetical protein